MSQRKTSQEGSGHMPVRTRPLDAADGPLARFALELRQLRDRAPAGRPASVAKVVTESRKAVSRAAIYAALGGRTLPSRDTLAVMVRAWSPGGDAELPAWNERRSKCEQELSLADRRSGRAPDLAGAPREGAGQRTGVGYYRFGEEMRKYRILSGLSLGETAKRVNYSKGYLSKVENGQKPPNSTLARLLDTEFDAKGELSGLV
jgi:DNA-binding XRE family transcriptional regulator